MEAEMEMPCSCELCGDWFDLNDGHPCHKCNKVFCTDCAEDDDEHGWICDSCKPDPLEKVGAYNVGHWWCEPCQKEHRLDDEADLCNDDKVECDQCNTKYVIGEQ